MATDTDSVHDHMTRLRMKMVQQVMSLEKKICCVLMIFFSFSFELQAMFLCHCISICLWIWWRELFIIHNNNFLKKQNKCTINKKYHNNDQNYFDLVCWYSLIMSNTQNSLLFIVFLFSLLSLSLSLHKST